MSLEKDMLQIKQVLSSYNFRLLTLAGIVILIILSTLPYFNLILSQQITLLLLLMVLVSILRFSFKFLFAIAMVFILFSLVLLLLSLNSTAEKLGNYAYMLLLLGFALSFIRFLNQNGKNN